MGNNLNQIDFHKLLDETYAHLWNGRSRLALTNSKILFKNYPNNSEAAIILAWALLENGYPIKALEYADLAIQLNGSTTKSKMVRAQILLRLNILDGAVDDFKSSIKSQTKFLGNSYLQFARLEASKGELLKATKLVEKSLLSDSSLNEEVNDIKELLLSAIELKSSKTQLNKKNLQIYFNKATLALKSKDIWYVNIIANEILKNKSLKEFHGDAELIKLEGLLHSFQFKPALELAKTLEKKFKKNEQFKIIYNKIIKKQKAQDNISAELDNEFFELSEKSKPKAEKRTDSVFYTNEKVDLFSLKVFNQHDEINTGKRVYYDQLDFRNLKKAGIEIIFENLLFEKSENEYKARIIWYLNDFEIHRNDFKILVPIDWDTVIFTQFAEVKWKPGQARIEIYIEDFKVGEKWFYVDSTNQSFETSIPNPKEDGNDEKIESPKSKTKEIEETVEPELPPARPLEELLEELNGFVGLNSVKTAVKEFIDYLKFQQEREKRGLSGGNKLSINAVFKGNPGTGKTTIARLIGEIFRAMGIVEKGHVVEVDRSTLVGQYVGETAQKTEKLIQDAMGGILFIDEAYTLVKKGGSGQDFGQEAIDILLKRMEDKKGEFVVIVAGYPKEMETFIESNPGLKSRFNHTFDFDDYTPDELIEIFSNVIKKEEYEIEDSSKTELKKEFTRLYRKRDSSFGNARLVIQFFEKLKIKISKRLVNIDEKEKTKEMLSTFILDDVKSCLQTKDETNVQLPIDQEALSTALAELNSLFGLKSIKNEVAELVKLVKYFIKQGVNVRDKFSDHILFLGNPGTGKTTVARILSNIYSALGILPNGQLIEVDRSGLVGSHVGETAQKTTLVVGSAMGGTLFVDEAYALTSGGSNDFGKEAIDTLLKRMEDDRGKFLVIAAGYTNEMKSFIASNPGMKSRFTKTFFFEDYTPEELMKIAKFSVDKLNLVFNPEAESALKTHFNILYSKRDKHFGNARIVRNLLEKVKKQYLLRIAEENNEETKNIITLDDVKKFVEKEKEKIVIKTEPVKHDNLGVLLKELNNLTGQNSIKEQLKKQIKAFEVSKLRGERGFKVVSKNLNYLLIGNHGSGTSEVAQFLGKVFRELQFLKSGHVFEVNGNDLIVADKEQARNKIEDYINKALDGILFIDNPYPLFENEKLCERIFDTLLSYAEKNLGRLAIFISGSRDEMEVFTHPNPNIRIKFNETLFFEDFSPRELLSITADLAKNNNYSLDEGALQIILDLFIRAEKIQFRKFQNIRLAEQILFKAISNQEERISMLYNLKDHLLTTIIIDDVIPIQIEEL